MLTELLYLFEPQLPLRGLLSSKTDHLWCSLEIHEKQ